MMKKIIVDHNLQELSSHGSKAFPLWCASDHYDSFYQKSYDTHWHKEFEIIFVIQGRLALKINDEMIILEKNQTLFINSNALHQGSALVSDTQSYVLIFPFELLTTNLDSDIYNDYIAPILKGPSYLRVTNTFAHLFKEIYELYSFESPESKLRIMPHIFELWLHIYQSMNAEQHIILSSLKLKRLKTILTFIHENYQRDISLKEISASVSLSVSECSKLFKSYMKQTIFDYIIKYRVQMSVHLIKENHYTIQVISEMVGFNQVSYFIAAFKEYFNQTPKQYQLALNKNI